MALISRFFLNIVKYIFCRKVGPGKVVCGGKSWGLGEPTVCASISSAITSLSCFHISYYHYRNLNCFCISFYHTYKLFVSHHQFNNYHNNVRQIQPIMQNWPHSWRDSCSREGLRRDLSECNSFRPRREKSWRSSFQFLVRNLNHSQLFIFLSPSTTRCSKKIPNYEVTFPVSNFFAPGVKTVESSRVLLSSSAMALDGMAPPHIACVSNKLFSVCW